MPTTHKIKRVPFKDWTAKKLDHYLGYLEVETLTELKTWLQVNGEIPSAFCAYIEMLRQDLRRQKTVWNELELNVNFIGPLLTTVRFVGRSYNNYCGRGLSAVVGELYELYGETDWMIAFGDDEPQTPFFFIHEYKRTKGSESDPQGQLLAAMIAAQHLNQDNKPLYGAYILGNIWYFVVLVEKTYAISTAYDALDAQELTQIWLILHKRKVAIEAEVETLVKNRTILP